MIPNGITRRLLMMTILGSLLVVFGCVSTPRSTYRRAQRAGLEAKVAAALRLDEEVQRELEGRLNAPTQPSVKDRIDVVEAGEFFLATILIFSENGFVDLEARHEATLASLDDDYEKALRIEKRLHDAEPRSPVYPYDISEIYCLLGEKEEACQWLQKAVDAGYDKPIHDTFHDTFKLIYDTVCFKKLVEIIESKPSFDNLLATARQRRQQDKDWVTGHDDALLLSKFLGTTVFREEFPPGVDYEEVGRRLGISPEKATQDFIETLLTGWTVKLTVDEPVLLDSRATIDFTDLLGIKRRLFLKRQENDEYYVKWKVVGFDPSTMDTLAEMAWEKGLYDPDQSLDGDRSKINVLVDVFLRGQMTERDYVAESVLLSLELYPFEENKDSANEILRAAGQKLKGASCKQESGPPDAHEYAVHVSPEGRAIVKFGAAMPVRPSVGLGHNSTAMASTYLTPDQALVTVPENVPMIFQEWVARDTHKANGFGTNELLWGDDIDASHLSLLFVRQEESWKLAGVSSGIWGLVDAPAESNRSIVRTTADFADALISHGTVDWKQLEINSVFTLAGQALSWGVAPGDNGADEITKGIKDAFKDRDFARAVSKFRPVIVTRHGRTAFVAMAAPETNLMLYYRLLKGPQRWTIVSITDSPEGEPNDR